MIYYVIAVVVVVAVAGMVLLSVTSSRRKKEAIADLDRELEALHTPDILELVRDEVRDTGIGGLPGAEGIDPTTLLRVWKRDRGGCPDGTGRFVIPDEIDPAEATEDNVTFVCE